MRLIGRVITAFDSSLLSATQIEHGAPRPTAPEPEDTEEYGRYLATTCTLCHGSNLTGATLQDGSGVRAPNITPSGALGTWSEEDFVETIRTDVTPAGNSLDKENMPWDRLSKMTDGELESIWIYLSSLTPVTSGG